MISFITKALRNTKNCAQYKTPKQKTGHQSLKAPNQNSKSSTLGLALCKIILLLITPALALAQTNSKAPVEITAENFLEWRRAQKIFIAEGNAKAAQGETSITAGTLRANYTDKNGKGMQISELGATGSVIIRSKDNTAYGDYATYNIPAAYAEMTGQNLRMTSPDQTLTASEKFEYWVNDGRILAIGNAKVIRPKPDGSGTDTLQSNSIIATLEEINGKREVKTLEAKDNVVITTPKEKATGNYAIYRKSSNTVELTGNVKITRGPNILTGTRATVDLNTNISKIYGSGNNAGRVRGTFFPGSEKSDTPAPPKDPKPAPIQTPSNNSSVQQFLTPPSMPEKPTMQDIKTPERQRLTIPTPPKSDQ